MSFQRVNLLTADLIPPRQWLTARELGVAVGLFAILLVGYSGLQLMSLPGLTEIEDSARQQLQRMGMAPVVAASAADLNTEIAVIQVATTHQQAVLAQLRGKTPNRFSDYLKELAYARVEGLWFENIELINEHGGTRIGLFGRTTTASKLPELLVELSESEVFGGYHFTDLRMNKDQGQIEFSLFTEAGEAS